MGRRRAASATAFALVGLAFFGCWAELDGLSDGASDVSSSSSSGAASSSSGTASSSGTVVIDNDSGNEGDGAVSTTDGGPLDSGPDAPIGVRDGGDGGDGGDGSVPPVRFCGHLTDPFCSDFDEGTGPLPGVWGYIAQNSGGSIVRTTTGFVSRPNGAVATIPSWTGPVMMGQRMTAVVGKSNALPIVGTGVIRYHFDMRVVTCGSQTLLSLGSLSTRSSPSYAVGVARSGTQTVAFESATGGNGTGNLSVTVPDGTWATYTIEIRFPATPTSLKIRVDGVQAFAPTNARTEAFDGNAELNLGPSSVTAGGACQVEYDNAWLEAGP